MWKIAMQKEIDACQEQNTWNLVERFRLPEGANVIPVKWVYKIKTDENGVVSKYKARITPKGFKQRHGVDYFEVFAHTGKYKSLRVLFLPGLESGTHGRKATYLKKVRVHAAHKGHGHL